MSIDIRDLGFALVEAKVAFKGLYWGFWLLVLLVVAELGRVG